MNPAPIDGVSDFNSLTIKKSKKQKAKDVLDRLLIDSNKRQTRKMEILEIEQFKK